MSRPHGDFFLGAEAGGDVNAVTSSLSSQSVGRLDLVVTSSLSNPYGEHLDNVMTNCYANRGVVDNIPALEDLRNPPRGLFRCAA